MLKNIFVKLPVTPPVINMIFFLLNPLYSKNIGSGKYINSTGSDNLPRKTKEIKIDFFFFFYKADRIYFLESATRVGREKSQLSTVEKVVLSQNNPKKKTFKIKAVHFTSGPTFQRPKCWPAGTGPQTPSLNPVCWTNVASGAVRMFVYASAESLRTAVTDARVGRYFLEFRTGRRILLGGSWPTTWSTPNHVWALWDFIQIACCLIMIDCC